MILGLVTRGAELKVRRSGAQGRAVRIDGAFTAGESAHRDT
jgi:hypothetical protein